jgi:hypothetical protein
MQDQAGFDRLAETDFVGQQDAGGRPSRHFRRDVQLVGNEFNPASNKTAHFGFSTPVLLFQGGGAEIEHVGRVQLTGEQTFFGFAEADRVVQFRCTQFGEGESCCARIRVSGRWS